MEPSPQTPPPALPEPVDKQLQAVSGPAAPAEAVAPSTEEGGETIGPPADWLARVQRSGPPAHWVERVRQGAPHLLNDAELELEPADFRGMDPVSVNPAVPEVSTLTSEAPILTSSEDDNQAGRNLPKPTPPAAGPQTQPATFSQRPVRPARLRPVLQDDAQESVVEPPKTAEPKAQLLPNRLSDPDEHPTSEDTDRGIPADSIQPRSQPATAISVARSSPPPVVQSADFSQNTSRTVPAIQDSPTQPAQPVKPVHPVQLVDSLQPEEEVRNEVSREVNRPPQPPPTESRTRSSAAPAATHVAPEEIIDPRYAVPRFPFYAGDAFEETQLSVPPSQTTMPHIVDRQIGRRRSAQAIAEQARPSRSPDLWPSLPEEPPAESHDWARVWREDERRKRLDREQRGEAWNA